MKIIQNIALIALLGAFALFNAVLFMGGFTVSENDMKEFIKAKEIKSEYFAEHASEVAGEYNSALELSSSLLEVAQSSHNYHREIITALEKKGADKEVINTEWGKVIWLKETKKHGSFAYPLVKATGSGFVVENKLMLFLLTFVLGAIGGLLYILPAMVTEGPAGIKNDGIFQNQATNKGWIAWLVFLYLVGFYLVLYFLPDLLVNLTYVVDPVSTSLNGGSASQWFLYGLLYCFFMVVMGIKMIIKYRHSKYQIVRSLSVIFFQVGFAFLIPEMLVRLNLPWYDFKNAWPLNYTFFFDWNVSNLLANGNMGMFMLVWGIVLTLIIVPVMVYFFGKRWYCSWVCGCGGLAETVGDPYRQHSDKSTKAWKFERYIIHSVFLFAIIMTIGTLTRGQTFLGIPTEELRFWYGFAIGSIFSGVIGTGFYPIFGNRVWCRFGCPLAAYMGIIQRYKSRFRITTNGAQCISCGNCSTYCEQGIDVRAYAQKGENIVRASCVGCGVCSEVCPRGVLKLENGPEEGRISENPINIEKNNITLNNLSE
ncbi:MAG: ferredoxin-type protein NapH [Saprospiraceae bacterium]|jgi:ferredoxin-type protein NapH